MDQLKNETHTLVEYDMKCGKLHKFKDTKL